MVPIRVQDDEIEAVLRLSGSSVSLGKKLSCKGCTAKKIKISDFKKNRYVPYEFLMHLKCI